jgi:D-glycero-D-manno-heptose 1,7-bisphosphate phosphatase
MSEDVNGLWAVFLDRDGTINEHVGLVSRPEELQLMAGVASALKILKDAGAVLLLITNQPVVAREIVDEAGLVGIHDRLQELLAAEGAELDGIYYCPHHPETHHPEAADPRYRRECECRKPKPGMILAAAKEFDINLGASFFVGDSTRDIAAATAAGCTPVLVRTGFGGKDGVCQNVQPEVVVENMAEAAQWIIERRVTA